MEIVEYNGEIIEYVVERKKIKNCYISVKDGKVIVKVPNRISDKKVKELIEKRANWIIDNVKKQKQKIRPPHEYVDGEKFRILGKDAILDISYENIKQPKVKLLTENLNVIVPVEYEQNDRKIIENAIESFYNELAEKEVEKAMRKMSMKVGLVPNRYKIKKLKSTWGNCSTTRNISINKNIIFYSRHSIEYVCLHELCHLRYMNHSKDFWNLVERNMPDYKLAEQELKEY